MRLKSGVASVDPAAVPQAHVSWRPSYRLIASRFPTVGLYDRVADPADLEVVFAIEALANPRIRDEIGELRLVPVEDRVSGPGATPIMAAFTHLNPEGSRFSDGSYGVYYAAHSLDTAVAEVSHHRSIFMRRTAEPAIDLDLRLIAANVEAELHDLSAASGSAKLPRSFTTLLNAVLDADAYGASQRLARALRDAGSHGIRYPSVRDAGGECVAIFRPKALRHAKVASHIALHWDGTRISHWFEKQAPRAVGPS